MVSRARPPRVPTAVLLTCAAIGVAGGILLTGAWTLAVMMFGVAPVIRVSLAGFWLLPAVIALRLIQRPFVGLLVGLVSGLVLSPFYTVGAIATTLFWAAFPELPHLLTLYRRWNVWLLYAGALIAGVAYPVLAATSFNLWTMTLPLQIAFFAVCIASCLAGTWLGVVIADRLRSAGVARLARRRPVATPGR